MNCYYLTFASKYENSYHNLINFLISQYLNKSFNKTKKFETIFINFENGLLFNIL